MGFNVKWLKTFFFGSLLLWKRSDENLIGNNITWDVECRMKLAEFWAFVFFYYGEFLWGNGMVVPMRLILNYIFVGRRICAGLLGDLVPWKMFIYHWTTIQGDYLWISFILSSVVKATRFSRVSVLCKLKNKSIIFVENSNMFCC